MGGRISGSFKTFLIALHILTQKSGQVLGKIFRKHRFLKLLEVLFFFFFLTLVEMISSIAASRSLRLLLNPLGPHCLFHLIFVFFYTLPMLDGTLAGDFPGTVTSYS